MEGQCREPLSCTEGEAAHLAEFASQDFPDSVTREILTCAELQRAARSAWKQQNTGRHNLKKEEAAMLALIDTLDAFEDLERWNRVYAEAKMVLV